MQWRGQLHWMILLLCVLFSLVSAQGLNVSETYDGQYKSMFESTERTSPLAPAEEKESIPLKISGLKDTLLIDFESRQLTYAVYDTLTGKVVWHHQYGELDAYLQEMEESVRSGLWKRNATTQGKTEKKVLQNQEGLKFVVPTHIPQWLARVLGDKPPQLTISGNQRITLGVSRKVTATKNPQDSIDDGKEKYIDKDSDGQFKFEPVSDFAITGEIGRLLSLQIRLRGNIAADTFWEGAKEDLSEISIHYKEQIPGELENDIIQEVEIGKTNFSMPGTGLAGYATGSNEGLFGVKVRAKIGPLDLTTIASIEQAEALKKTIDLKGGASNTQRRERDFVQNQFFFVAPPYRDAYKQSTPSIAVIPSEKLIVLKEVTTINSSDVVDYGYVKIDTTGKELQAFKRLKEGDDYILDNKRGIINFRSNVGGSTRIGIILNADSTMLFGDRTLQNTVTSEGNPIQAYADVYMIKMSNQKSGDSTFNLMLRNVYSIGQTEDINSFKLGLVRVFQESDTSSKNDENSRLFTEILGISDTNGVLLTANDKIFDFSEGYLFLPPFTTTDTLLDPLLPFSNPALGKNKGEENKNPSIYDDLNSTVVDKFAFLLSSKSRPTSFSIDWGLVPEKEKISSGAKTYERDVDYSIEYGSGFVTLLSNEIKAQDNLEVEYQREALFLLDKRVFLGVNGMLNLPGIGENSFFSNTFMMQILNAKDNVVPKVGTEPYNRFLFDSNLKLAFKPYWMTMLSNLLPGVESAVESRAEFDVEIAHSTLKSSANDGSVASIDNFSTSSQTMPFGEDHTGWFQAGPDSLRSVNPIFNPPAWFSYWVQPGEEDEKSYRREIYDLQENEKVTQSMATLRFFAYPLPMDSTLRNQVADNNDTLLINPWAGIMRPLYGNGDLRESSYLEFWVRTKGTGTLFVDLGIVAEDLMMSGKAPNNGRDVESNLAEVPAAEDKGLDKESDQNEVYYYPNHTVSGSETLDTLGYGNPALGNFGYDTLPSFVNDPARDNWKEYTSDNLKNRYFVNGTDGNRKRKKSPDTEDLNADGGVVRPGSSESYFRYKVYLDSLKTKASPFYDSTQTAANNQPGYPKNYKDNDYDTTEWHHIRIPVSTVSDSLFNSPDSLVKSVNNPAWSDIQSLRLIWTDFADNINDTAPVYLEFQGMQIVGNQWLPMADDSTITNNAQVVVVTTDSKNTPDYERPNPADSTINDSITDYTLNLSITDLAPGLSRLVERNLGRSIINLTNYDDMRFWVGTDDSLKQSDNPWFVYRLGSSPNNYYEIKTREPWESVPNSKTGWYSKNGHVIILDTLTQLKLAWLRQHGEYSNVILDTAMVYNGTDTLRIYSSNRNYPSLNAISWMAFGVVNHGSSTIAATVKINALNSSGVREYRGWGFRSDLVLNWTDLMNNTARISYTDADFRSMTDDIRAPGTSDMSAGFTSSIQLQKFLPAELGIQLPVGGEISNKMSRPEFIPNSDISLRHEDGETDGVPEMTGDFVRKMFGQEERGDTTLAERYQSNTNVKTLYTGYNKGQTSETVAGRILADRVSVNYRLNYTEREDRKGLLPTNDTAQIDTSYGSTKFHVENQKSESQSLTLDYDVSPAKKIMGVTSWEPFKKSKNSTIKKISLNLLPEVVKLDLLRFNYGYNHTYNSISDVQDTTSNSNYRVVSRPKESITANHGLTLTYKPIAPSLTITFTKLWDRNFDQFLINEFGSSGNGYKGASDFMREGFWGFDESFKTFGVLHSEQRRTQNAKIAFSPDLAKWLTLRTSLGSSYNQNYRASDTLNTLEGMVKSDFDFSTTLRFRRLFESWAKRADKSGGEALKGISKGMTKVDFDGISFDYNASMNLQSTYLDSAYMNNHLDSSWARYTAYTLGVHNRTIGDVFTGNMDDQKTFGGVQHRDITTATGLLSLKDVRQTSQTIGGRTKLTLPAPVNISFNTLALSWTRNYTVNWETTRLDTSTTWPNINVQATSPLFEKIGFISKYFQSMKFSMGYNYSKTEVLRGVQNDTALDLSLNSVRYDSLNYQNTYRHGFSPLVKLDMRIKKYDISCNYYTNLLFDSTLQVDTVLTNKKITKSSPLLETHVRTVENVWEGNYHREGKRGRKLRIMKGQAVDILGDTDYGLLVRYKTRVFETDRNANSGLSEDEDYDEWEFHLSPKFTYQVTKNLMVELLYTMTNELRGVSRNYTHNGNMGGTVTFKF